MAWREIVSTRPDEPCRFDPIGSPVGEPSLVHTLAYHQDSRSGRRLDSPDISHWPDGSHVVGWADVTLTPPGPNLLTKIQARRYHATGWPVADPVTASGRATSSQFALQALACTGGYVVRHQGRLSGRSGQVIRLPDFWNPIDPACFSGLAVGSLLVPLGVCGNLLFAGRPAGDASAVRWERQLFNWSGQPVGEPVPLRQPGQLLRSRPRGNRARSWRSARTSTAPCTARRSTFPMGRRCRSMMAVWGWRGCSPVNRG